MKTEKLLPFAGRALLSAIFLLSGLGKIANFSGTASFMTAHGFPAASLFLIGAIALELAGGAAILTGFRARAGALGLVVFLIPATLVFHGFWAVPAGEREMQMVHFLKNLAILGGLVGVIAETSRARREGGAA